MDTKLCEELFKKDEKSIIDYFRKILIDGSSINTNDEIYYHNNMLIINTVKLLKLLDKECVTFLDFFTIITNINNNGRTKYLTQLNKVKLKEFTPLETQLKIDYLVEYFLDYYHTDYYIHTSTEWVKCFFVRYMFWTEFIMES